MSRTIMVQGTASGVGKTLLAAAICRILRDRGLSVAPFKAVNLSLNSAVTPDGLEIGRAQAFQALAARTPPRVEMNPVLLKPSAGGCQTVVLGQPAPDGLEVQRRAIAEALGRLRAEFDAVVIEGAGSPAEPNLRDRDLANMHVARLAGAPVVLVGDVERGGVFASLVGTLELLDAADRARVAGFVVNKLRGERALLAPGLEFLERRTGLPVLGVVPWIDRLRAPEEDSLSLPSPTASPDGVVIAVVRLPHLANHDEFDALAREPGVDLRYADDPREIEAAALAIVPGTKSTVADLRWLRETGLAAAIARRAAAGRPVLAICGGCQMLGGSIEDPEGVESSEPFARGLGLLPIVTRFEATKRTRPVRVRVHGARSLLDSPGVHDGYEIHMGRTRLVDGGVPAFDVEETAGLRSDGAAAGSVVGTMIHGLLEDDALRAALLSRLPVGAVRAPVPGLDQEIDRVASIVRSTLDIDRIAGPWSAQNLQRQGSSGEKS